MADKKTVKAEPISVVVVCEFIDKTDNTYRKVGDQFEATPKRAKELASLGFVKTI